MKRRTEREHLFITFLRVVIAALVGSFLNRTAVRYPDMDSKDLV